MEIQVFQSQGIFFVYRYFCARESSRMEWSVCQCNDNKEKEFLIKEKKKREKKRQVKK